MDSSVLPQCILLKIILNLYMVQYNHFVHNLQEHSLVDILPNRLQHNIFEN